MWLTANHLGPDDSHEFQGALDQAHNEGGRGKKEKERKKLKTHRIFSYYFSMKPIAVIMTSSGMGREVVCAIAELQLA